MKEVNTEQINTMNELLLRFSNLPRHLCMFVRINCCVFMPDSHQLHSAHSTCNSMETHYVTCLPLDVEILVTGSTDS